MNGYSDFRKNRKMFRNRKTNSQEFIDPKYSKTVKRKPHTDFGIYCKGLMKNSLITGFPVLAASNSTFRRVIKGLVLLVCTAGFIYQTHSFLEMYLTYPTILDLSVIYPETIDAPAVTFCNRNRIHRTTFCKHFEKECDWRYNDSYDTFCEHLPTYCPARESRPVLGYLEIRAKNNLNKSHAFLNLTGPQSPKDYIAFSAIKTVEKNITPLNTSSIVAANGNGYPFRCYSLLSLVGNPDDTPLTMSLSDEFNILLTLQPEEYVMPEEPIQAYLFVHDPRGVANPIAEGITLDAGNIYKIYMTMERRESLPPPYKTNCTDYVSLWKKNGGTGPISKRGCTDVCKMEAMMKEFGCVSQRMTYPNSYPMCTKKFIGLSAEVNNRCSDSCNDACESNVYSLTTEVKDKVNAMCYKKDAHCLINNLLVSISSARMTITKYKQEPKFQSVELFSYIGGYMGMWLGISLVSLFDLVEMMFDVLAYPFHKWRKADKKKSRTGNMQRSTPFSVYGN